MTSLEAPGEEESVSLECSLNCHTRDSCLISRGTRRGFFSIKPTDICSGGGERGGFRVMRMRGGGEGGGKEKEGEGEEEERRKRGGREEEGREEEGRKKEERRKGEGE